MLRMHANQTKKKEGECFGNFFLFYDEYDTALADTGSMDRQVDVAFHAAVI